MGDLLNRACQIRDAEEIGENTALRVGGLLVDMSRVLEDMGGSRLQVNSAYNLQVLMAESYTASQLYTLYNGLVGSGQVPSYQGKHLQMLDGTDLVDLEVVGASSTSLTLAFSHGGKYSEFVLTVSEPNVCTLSITYNRKDLLHDVIEILKVNGVALPVLNRAVDISIPAYQLVKLPSRSTTSGYLSTYVLSKDGVMLSTKIDIPKDYAVNSAEFKICQAANTPVEGFSIGDIYIDILIDVVEGQTSSTARHIYSSALPVASGSSSGMMSAADKAKLDGIAEGAVRIRENGALYIDAYDTDSISLELDFAQADGEDGQAIVDIQAATPGHAGVMSAADKAKLNKIVSFTADLTTSWDSSLITDVLTQLLSLGTSGIVSFLYNDVRVITPYVVFGSSADDAEASLSFILDDDVFAVTISKSAGKHLASKDLLSKNDVIDDLVSTVDNKPLSAKQGKVLDAKKQDKTEYASLKKISPLFYQVHLNQLDYGYAENFFGGNAPANAGACSTIFKNGKFGRNFDWYAPEGSDADRCEFLVTTPKTEQLHAVMGMAAYDGLTKAIVESRAANDAWKILPFYLADGVNDAGLFACMNVVPRDKGNNTKTVPSSTETLEINELMLVRYILDHWTAATLLSDLSQFQSHTSVVMAQSLIDMGYDLHIVVGADNDERYVIEFVNNGIVVTDITNRSIVTNFHITGVTFPANGKVWTNADVASHTPSSIGITNYGSGLERYNKLVDGGNDVRALMNSILYSKTYDLNENPFWYSEYVNRSTAHPVTVNTAINNTHMTYWKNLAQDIKAGRVEGRLWMTTHSVVYDLSKLTANVVSFEDVSNEWLFGLKWAGSSVDIMDNLTSTRADAALSANQGKVLNDRLEAIEPMAIWGGRKFCVAKWLNDYATATDAELNNPDALEVLGDKAWATRWLPHLYDMTPVEGETSKTPVLDLNRCNWLRDTNGNFAPVIGITQAQYDECMANDLYIGDEHTAYCTSGNYDAVAFFNDHCQIEEVDGVKVMTHDTLYKLVEGDYVEVSHYLMPYETTEKKYSIFVAHDDDLYLLDGLVGNSGKEWNGVLGHGADIWDGVDLRPFKLVPTGISPSPVTSIKVGTKTVHRSFFFDYENTDIANANGYAGYEATMTLFKGGHYPHCGDISQFTNMDYARNNNYDTTKPYPVAEGGYHARNTFLTCMETAFGTKYLCKNVRFSSGISANDSCNSEATWLSNGGLRYKKHEVSTWSYGSWGTTPAIYYANSGSYSSTNFASLLTKYNLRSKTLEAQMAASFAKEWNIPASTWFEFRGNEWKYENVSEITVNGLAQGEMNVRMYKKVVASFDAYNSDGTPQTFDIEVILRVGLIEGVDMSGDGAVYWGGGAEMVGLATEGGSGGSEGNKALCYLQNDQKLWLNNRTYSMDISSGNRFPEEDAYNYLGESAGGKYSYVRRHVPYSPAPLIWGTSLSTGECYYSYDRNYWGALGKRVRQGLRFGVAASFGILSVRFSVVNYSAGYSARFYAGSAQVLHQRRSPLQAE